MGRFAMLAVFLLGCGRLGFDGHDPAGGGADPVEGDPGSGPSAPGDPDGPDATPAVQMPTAGLVSYWDFDDLSASGAMSTTGSNSAACSGGECPQRVTGVTGMAASFNGSTSCLHVPSMSTWTATSVTLSAWVRVPSANLTDTLPVLTRDADACPSPGIQLEQGQVGFMFMGLDSTHYHAWTTGPSPLTGDAWHQLAVRWDGTTESVFVDGVCACSAEPGHQILFDGTDYELQLGCDTNTPTYGNATIDEVRIYNRALTDDEMATLAAAGGGAAPAPHACAATCELTTAGP